jgi:putative FmdB family regulatory protein
MPLHEYACEECGRKDTRLVLKKGDEEALKCRQCGSDQLKRLISRVAIHRTEADRMADVSTSGMPDESYYSDNRNIGLRAKKRMKELGVDLGDAFEEKLEKARTTTNLDDLTSD